MQVTSGEYVDRDVDITIYKGQVIVAFSRCNKPGGRSAIWLWKQGS